MGKTFVSKTHLVLSFIVTILLPITRGDLVDDACKSSPLPDVCISVLRADPRSKTADIAGLVLLAVDAIQVKSIATLDEIKRLIDSNPTLNGPFSNCAKYYNFIIQADVPQSKEALIIGKPVFAKGAVTDAGNEARNCEQGFAPSQSPLTASNNAIYDLSVVSLGIINLLI